MLKFALSVVCFAMLLLCGCQTTDISKDNVPDLNAERLYEIAQANMSAGNYAVAIGYLEAIDSRYPFGELTDQVQLDLIYSYYKNRDSALTSAAIARYQRLNPAGQYNDYVQFMKGLNEMQKHSDLIQDFIGLDRSQKDPTYYYEAFRIFDELIKTYPNSPYAHDAYLRMIYIKDQLAAREYKIAQYYFEREAYLSSIRHCQSILYSFRDTQYMYQALSLMAQGYDKLGLTLPAQNTRSVIDASF